MVLFLRIFSRFLACSSVISIFYVSSYVDMLTVRNIFSGEHKFRPVR
jgi:hypothetical protein